MGALASSWHVRSKYALGSTSHRGIVGSGGRMARLAAHDRSSATFRRSSWSKWNELLEVLGSTFAPSVPSNVTAEKPKVLTSVMESPKTFVWEEEQRVTNTVWSNTAEGWPTFRGEGRFGP